METDVTMDLLQLNNNLNRNITMDTAVWYMSERIVRGQLEELETVWFENCAGADVCIWLRTPFGWKTEFVSGNYVREAREFIPWTVKTVDRRG
jgi:hypothetical protein